jgi:oligopeptide transport system permease protein
VILLFALFGPLASPYSYDEIHLSLKNLPPSRLFWFGTDDLGRDLFCRTAWGARISLSIGFFAAFVDLFLGVLIGTLGARYRLLMRLTDVLQGVPYLLSVILFTVLLGSGFTTLLIALTATGWISMARVTQAQVLQVMSSDYVQAALVMGASRPRLFFRHLIPNAISPIIAMATLTIPGAIFTEAFLSFLGLGIQAPSASWGTLISDGVGAMRYYPWRLFIPAGLMTLTMLSIQSIGQSLRNTLDPRFYGA